MTYDPIVVPCNLQPNYSCNDYAQIPCHQIEVHFRMFPKWVCRLYTGRTDHNAQCERMLALPIFQGTRLNLKVLLELQKLKTEGLLNGKKYFERSAINSTEYWFRVIIVAAIIMLATFRIKKYNLWKIYHLRHYWFPI